MFTLADLCYVTHTYSKHAPTGSGGLVNEGHGLCRPQKNRPWTGEQKGGISKTEIQTRDHRAV